MNLPSFLDEQGVSYKLSHHNTAYTAQELAQVEHVSGKAVIKPVVVRVDGEFVMCALPASYRVDLRELRDELDADHLDVAEESALSALFPDVEIGAMPPIGKLWGLPTLMDESLMDDSLVTFQAGTHQDAVTMTLAEYCRLAQPQVVNFGRPAR